MLLGAPRPGGWDRGRVGERLQAALAGLQELQVLREKQRELVRAALAMPQRPAAGGEQQPLSAHSKEHRLEATLSALKEQLVRHGTARHGTGRPAACAQPRCRARAGGSALGCHTPGSPWAGGQGAAAAAPALLPGRGRWGRTPPRPLRGAGAAAAPAALTRARGGRRASGSAGEKLLTRHRSFSGAEE